MSKMPRWCWWINSIYLKLWIIVFFLNRSTCRPIVQWTQSNETREVLRTEDEIHGIYLANFSYKIILILNVLFPVMDDHFCWECQPWNTQSKPYHIPKRKISNFVIALSADCLAHSSRPWKGRVWRQKLGLGTLGLNTIFKQFVSQMGNLTTEFMVLSFKLKLPYLTSSQN